MGQWLNPFELPGRWVKANLHTHSTVSDGRASPAERCAQYREAGYEVLALTDHRRTQDVAGLGDENFLVISGIEVHPPCEVPPGLWHFVGLGVPGDFQLADPPCDAQGTIDRLRAAGAAVVLAHPSWCGQGFADFRQLRGFDAVEVWNSTCDRHGRPSSESEWSMALDHGWQLPAIAVDDTHGLDSGDVFEAWTWLKVQALTVDAVLAALRGGLCYCSTGPAIEEFGLTDGVLHLRCSAAAQIQFVGPPVHGVRCRASAGELTEYSVNVSDLAHWPWPYVRAVVTDARGRKAWTNPIYRA